MKNAQSCTVLGPDEDLSILNDPKIDIVFRSKNMAFYERYCLKALYCRCQKEDCRVLYLHSKGVSKRKGKSECVADWVECLLYFTVDLHEVMLEKLCVYDAVGSHLHLKKPIIFGGNFWWSKSSHIRKLSPYIRRRYGAPEMWIGEIRRSYTFWSPWRPSGHNHYVKPYPRSFYVDKPFQNLVYENKIDSMALLTFIIPTKGRASLNQTLQSLLNQTRDTWKAIVIGDGHAVNAEYVPNDANDRITTICIPKAGRRTNSAGAVRNAGIAKVDTPWIGFVDDDDVVTPDYVEKFEDSLSSNPDVIIFRMQTEKGPVFPPAGAKTFSHSRVGISFALKTSLCNTEGFLFEPSRWEDYNLLDALRKAKKTILMSPHITYIVRPHLNVDKEEEE